MNLIASGSKPDEASTPTISVAMPVYNGEKYLTEAIDSILAQTYKDFEFIIIDDGSTDKSLQMLKEYQRRDTRIRLIARENRNLATTLNDIIDLACGRWIARMDQDDIALPQRFARQLQWLEKTGADICGSWVKHFGAMDRRCIKHPQTDDAIKMELMFGTPFAHPAVMMSTAMVRQLRYDRAWEKCEDYDLWERAARVGWKMTNIQEVLLLYRQHGDQISISTSNQQQVLTQKIRQRYWEFVFDSMGLKRDWIVEVLNIREPSTPIPNMGHIDAVFSELLHGSHGEARETIFDHVTRLYFRVAGDCPDVVARWGKLNKCFGTGFALVTKAKLWLLSVFRIRSDRKSFARLKKLYFYLTGST